MINTRRTKRVIGLVVGVSLLAAACGGDDDDEGSEPAPEETAEEPADDGDAEEPADDGDAEEPADDGDAEEPADDGDAEEPADDGDAEEPAGEAAMRVTYTLSDIAVWNDGAPITAADFECTWNANVNTPASISTTGYDQIISVSEGASPQEVVVDFQSVYAPWRNLFGGPGLLKNDMHDDCNDVSGDFNGAFEYGAGEYIMSEWTPEQAIWEKNPGYIGERTGGPDRIVFVPTDDSTTAIKSGNVDFVFPQPFTGIDAELEDPNVDFDAAPGGQFEAFYFLQDPDCVPDDTRSCAFADDIYRQAFSMSIDMNAVYEQIYAPFAQGLPLLTCGPVAPGPYCEEGLFSDTYDPEGAAALLEENGWTQDGSGMWVNPDGEVPEVHFMVSAPNPRREGTQEFLIPLMADLGFNVIADNCEAVPCVFQTRLPAGLYDFTMYISTVAPDPAYITSSFTCGQVPSEANDFQGQNGQFWCNEEASEMLEMADQELDQATREELVKGAIALMKEDHVLLPLLQFPNLGAYRTDKVDGTQNNLANYWAFKDWYNFEDLDGDGQVVIGAEQFPTPDCANVITECANSSWYQWVVGFMNFPWMYETTNELTYEPSQFLAGEAVVEEL